MFPPLFSLRSLRLCGAFHFLSDNAGMVHLPQELLLWV